MLMNFKGVIPAMVLGSLAWIGCGHLAAQQRDDVEKAEKHKELLWIPPNVTAALPSLSATPACSLSEVLQEASRHAAEMTSNLETFAAEEQIDYRKWDHSGFPEDNDSSAFDYVFGFEQTSGGRSSREYRTPAKGGHFFPASSQDTGLVALALIFLPSMQTEYDMNCEGLDKWKGQFAWVVRFQQRKDKPRRTMQFRTSGGVYEAMLRGRAWISMDNGQVLHLEASLMNDIPALNLRSGAISVDYAPVEIQSRKIELWLPERVEAYWEIANRRLALYHTFSNFKLFTVETEDTVKKPKQP